MEQFALRRLLVAPVGLTRMPDLTAFRYVTLLSLLAAEDLALISIWSPTFLTALLGPLEEWQEQLCDDLRHGTLSTELPGAAQSGSRRRAWLRPDPARAAFLSRTLQADAPRCDRLRRIWPRLALISCWTDAAAARFLPDLQRLFPGVEIQPKGLLATEGFVSFPLLDRPGAALALRCHFFEFEELAGTHCRLAHELELGSRYRMILTTAGGLYRYQLRDEVEVVGFEQQCPLLRFAGKSDAVSDLVGEKLSEEHVRAVLDDIFRRLALQPHFSLLAPILGRPPRYHLYVQAAGFSSASPLLGLLRERLESGLARNPHFRQARAAGQLGPIGISALAAEGNSAWNLYERRCLEEGQKCGNIKPMALDRRMGWDKVFACLEEAGAGDRRQTVFPPPPTPAPSLHQASGAGG
jgi:hypothetical protein